MYGIINKQTKEFFAGFGSDNNPVWTNNKRKAWTNCKIAATGQASLLFTNGHRVQKKPVIVK